MAYQNHDGTEFDPFREAHHTVNWLSQVPMGDITLPGAGFAPNVPEVEEEGEILLSVMEQYAPPDHINNSGNMLGALMTVTAMKSRSLRAANPGMQSVESYQMAAASLCDYLREAIWWDCDR